MVLTFPGLTSGQPLGPGSALVVQTSLGPTATDDVCRVFLVDTSGVPIVEGETIFRGSVFAYLFLGFRIRYPAGLQTESPILNLNANPYPNYSSTLRIDAAASHASGTSFDSGSFGPVGYSQNDLYAFVTLLVQSSARSTDVLSAVQRTFSNA